MQVLTLRKIQLNDRELRRAFAEEKDCDRIVEGAFTLIDADTQEVVAVNMPIDDVSSAESLRNALLKLKNWTVASRGSGLKTTAKVFGYQPRNPIRQRPFCHRGVLAKEQPEVHNELCRFSMTAERIFEHANPKAYAAQRQETFTKVKPEWRMHNTMYTSGIANNNNALGYHRDRGNFEDYWSAMAVFRKDIDGGNLIVKDYGIKIRFSDSYIFFFNGQKWWHGVTPIKKLSPSAYRFTVVYYALREMWKCMTMADELAHAVKLRQEIELRRLKK